MSKKVTLTGYDFDELSRPLEQGIAIIQCAIDYACPGNDTHAPYLEPALSAAVDLLMKAKDELDAVKKRADKPATGKEARRHELREVNEV